jgi:S-adenosylmethionine synthetase
MARYVAKNIVAAGWPSAARCSSPTPSAWPEPVAVHVDTFGTGTVPEIRIEEAVQKVFDLTPGGIIAHLDLKRPIYQDTATYGHFGRDMFPWEKTDKVKDLQQAVG